MNPPEIVSFDDIDSQSVRLFWNRVEGALSYDVKIEGEQREVNTESTEIILNGLLPASEFTAIIRSVGNDNKKSDWLKFSARTTYGLPQGSPDGYSVIGPIGSYNNVMFVDLDDFDGNSVTSIIRLWWQPSDNGWWADLESPANTPIVMGRKMGLNCGLLDGINGVMGGNIVMRSKSDGSTIEPGSECFKQSTHELRWEPYQ